MQDFSDVPSESQISIDTGPQLSEYEQMQLDIMKKS